MRELKMIKTTKKIKGKIKEKIKEKTAGVRKIVFSPFLFLPTILFCLPFLSGCAGMRSNFDCNVSSGGGCTSMKQVNKMADQGVFSRDNFYKKGSSGKRKKARNEKSRFGRHQYKKHGYPLDAFEGSPIRSNESIQQIWIGPYEDADGNYHEPSYVYTVIKKGSWMGEPANVIQD